MSAIDAPWVDAAIRIAGIIRPLSPAGRMTVLTALIAAQAEESTLRRSKLYPQFLAAMSHAVGQYLVFKERALLNAIHKILKGTA